MLKNYNINRCLGSGGMGAVYEVERRQGDRQRRALKQLPLDGLLGDALKQARLETKTLQHFVTHRNLVKIHAAFEDDMFSLAGDRTAPTMTPGMRAIYIEMEYCGGGTLRDKIQQMRKQKTFFEEREIIHWFTDTLLVVKYLHEDGIIHRDIKSQDIFFTNSGQNIKLGAFGLALSLEDQTPISGSLEHMAPECFQRGYKPNAKEDIWALGVLLYELMTLEMPFNGNNNDELMESIKRADFRRIAEGRYSADLRRLVERLLAKDPRDRPTAEDVCRDDYIFLEIERKLELEDPNRPSSVEPSPTPTFESLDKLKQRRVNNRQAADKTESGKMPNEAEKPSDFVVNLSGLSFLVVFLLMIGAAGYYVATNAGKTDMMKF